MADSTSFRFLSWCPVALILASLMSAAWPASAEEKIGLVLGGGGARGAAHVGVLKVLEREGIAVDYIAGTSMGAIVGALYASGYRPEEIEQILKRIEWGDSLRDLAVRDQLALQRKLDSALIPSSLEVGVGPDGLRLPQGVLQGQNIMLLLRRLLSGSETLESFDQLPIPFRAVAGDLGDGSRVVLSDGDLPTAVRASMSLPGVFQPVQLDGRILVDGAIVDNVPVSVAREMGATRLIVVDVGSPPSKPETLGTPASVLNQVLTLMIDRRTRSEFDDLGSDDLLIRPELGDLSSGAFDRSGEAVAPGEAAANERLAELQAFKASEARWARFEGRSRLDPQTGRTIVRVEADEGASDHAGLVEAYTEGLVGTKLDEARVENRIREAYGTGYFERLGYRAVPVGDDQVKLLLEPVDRSWGPDYLRLGLRLSDDFQGESSYQLDGLVRLRSDLLDEAEWRLGLALGNENRVSAEWLGYFGSRHRSSVRPYAMWREIDQPAFVPFQDEEFARYRWSTLRTGLEAGWSPTLDSRLYGRIELGRERLRLRIGDEQQVPEVEQNYGLVRLGYLQDTLDSIAFPGSGHRLDVGIDLVSEALGSDASTQILRLDAHKAFRWRRVQLLTSLTGNVTRDSDVTLQGLGFLGGLANLSGFAERQVVGTQSLIGRTIVMSRLTDESRLLSLPLYLGASVEAGNVWDDRRDIDLDDLILSGSVFIGLDTPLGPVFLGVGHADTDRTSLYLHFGSLIRARY